MATDPRRKGMPRRGPWGRHELTPRQEFQKAMIETAIESIHARGKPCILCDKPARNAGVWEPAPRFHAYLGVPPGKWHVVVYPFCDDCRPGEDTLAIERAILKHRRTHLALAEAGLEVTEDGIGVFASDDDLERFQAAWDRHVPPPLREGDRP